MTSTQQSNSLQATNTTSSTPDALPIYDLVCIGFGPVQLATAIANRETKASHKLLCLERKSSFSWHPESHTARTRMESPFMYDLATLRNPRTAFSYVNYLLAKKRLIEFANSDRLNPLREEFEDYLRWCAEQMKSDVRYGTEVVSVAPETKEEGVIVWKIAVQDNRGEKYTVRARNVVAPSPRQKNYTATGPLPTINFLAGQRIISMDEYSARRNELRGAHEPRLNISIVGSGQQTAEILSDVLSCPRLGNITVVTQDESMAPLTVLNEREPPQPQLCSIWTKPALRRDGSVTDASEVIQDIYMRGYEKNVQTKGEFRLRVVMGDHAAAAGATSDFIIRDTKASPAANSQLLQGLDTLILGCQQKGESLEEVHFKRGAVADGCRLWLVSSKSEGGRALAKDVAQTAGEIVRKVSSVAHDSRHGAVQVHARM